MLFRHASCFLARGMRCAQRDGAQRLGAVGQILGGRWWSTDAGTDQAQPDDYRWLEKQSPRTIMFLQQQTDKLGHYLNQERMATAAALYEQLQVLLPQATEAQLTEYVGKFRYVLTDPHQAPVRLYQDAADGTRTLVLEHASTLHQHSQVHPSHDGTRIAWLGPSPTPPPSSATKTKRKQRRKPSARGAAALDQVGMDDEDEDGDRDGVSHSGAQTLYVKDIRSGRKLVEWPGVTTAQWPGRSDAILCTTGDVRGRPDKVWLLHIPPRFAKTVPQPQVVFADTHDAHFVDVSLTKDQQFVLLHSHSKPSSEVRLLSPTHLDAQPRCVLPRKVGVQYTVEHWGGWLLMLTNAHSSRGPVVSTPTTSPVEEGDHGGEHEGEKQEGNGVKREGEHARTHHDVGMQMGGEYGGGGDGGYVIMCCPAPTHHEMQGGATLANRDPHHAGSPPTHPPTHTTTTTNTMASQNHEGPKEKTAGEQCEGGNVAPPWCVSTEQWGLVVDPGQDGVIVQHVDVMEDMLVLYGHTNATQPIIGLLPLTHTLLEECYTHHTPQHHDTTAPPTPLPRVRWIPPPTWATHMSPSTNSVPQAPVVQVALSSPLHPPLLCDLNLTTGTWQREDGVIEGPGVEPPWAVVGHPEGRPPAGVSPRHTPPPTTTPTTISSTPPPITTLWARSSDGVCIPITMVCGASDVDRDGVDGEDGEAVVSQQSRPTLVQVYGAYGQSPELTYDAGTACLLQLGWNVATAHIRGGGEYGRQWHHDGVGVHKQQGVDDLQCCIQHVIDQGYAQGGKVALQGMSGGGLVIGALLNQHPELLSAVVAQVPFVDLLGCMTDPSLPLTIHEYAEHGDPSDPETLAAMKALCPVHNVRRQTYPPVFVVASLDDTRVPYWGVCKWVAKLQECQTEPGNPILLCMSNSGGHFGHQEDGGETQAMVTMFLVDTADCWKSGSDE